MSKINVHRAVKTIRSGTNVYTPLVETIVNAIQAIEAGPETNGRVDVLVHRAAQEELEGGKPPVESFTVIDNGIGFNHENRESFDTLYTDQKIEQGGKGFGRFICLKYFEDLIVESVFEEGSGRKKRSFRMGKETDIIVDEKLEDCRDGEVGTRATMRKVKRRGFSDKPIKTMARTLVERLLPYFIDDDDQCPEVRISEMDGTDCILLNGFINNQLAGMIQEISLANNEIRLGDSDNPVVFKVRVFKLFSPRSQRSKISLVADRREVTNTAIHNYVPEFDDEFSDEKSGEDDDRNRNYIVKAYVFGTYLDTNVSLERGGFEFPKDDDDLTPPGFPVRHRTSGRSGCPRCAW